MKVVIMARKSERPSLVLTQEQRTTLQELSASRVAPVREVERAKVMLGYADGVSITELQRRLGFSRPMIYRCVDKALAAGIQMGLKDKYHRPHEPEITDEAKAWVVSIACTKPKDHELAAELWSISALARFVGEHAQAAGFPRLANAGKSTVWRILDDNDIKPHKIRYYLEKRDPDFDRKMQEVLMVYRDVSLYTEGAVHDARPNPIYTVSVDEKPGVQAIGLTAPDLPPVPGKAPSVGRDYEYVRHGTVSIMAGIDLHSGHIFANVEDRHRSIEFIGLLKQLDAHYPEDAIIRVVLDTYAPLLVNVNPGASQWGTNLIGYDALNSYGSPSYWAQVMFAQNQGDTVLPVEFAQDRSRLPAPKAPQGGIGVGTWNTQAEFRDIKVTQNARALYEKDFAGGADDWKLGQGIWKAQGGVLQQTGDATDTRATGGDPAWTDYTYELKARKTGGNEGFLVLFHAQDRDNYIWWNIGGWGNTRSGLERAYQGSKQQIGASAPMTVETGRWYAIRIEVKGRNIRCYLDDKLITEAEDTAVLSTVPLYAGASRLSKTGELILKVVNFEAAAQSLQINLQGAREVADTASAEVLTGSPEAMNTIAEPEKIAPKREMITRLGPMFTHTFPGYSVTVLRLKAK